MARKRSFLSLLFLFGALRAQADCNTPRLIRSAQAGNFNTGSTWVGGVVPTSCDFVVVDHAVTLDISFTVGQNGNGGLSVTNGASLTGTGQTISITGGAAYTFTNNGTVNIGSISFNGSGATFANNATATLNTSQTWNSGSYIENKGYLTVNGSILQADGVLRNDAIYGTLTVSGTVTLNGASKWDNTGRIVSTATDVSKSFFLQGTNASFYNRPTGRLKMLNGGLYQAAGTIINNENYIGVLNLETHDGALMMNTDSVMVGSNFINGDIFSNYAGANIRIGANFTQINKTGSILSNDGFVQIIGNFSNDKAIGGNGGGYTIGGTSTNTSNGQVTGTVDICDPSVSGNNANNLPNIFDSNANTNQGTNYGISTTTTRCQYVAPTASLKATDITGAGEVCSGSTGKVYYVPVVSGATSYIWTVPSGYTITATSPAGTISGGGTTAIINTTNTTGNVSITVTMGTADGVITLKTVGASASAYNYTSKLVKVSTGSGPSTPGAITGTGAAVCSASGGLTYSIAPVSGASTYTWTVPSGWTINYGQGTTSISATANATSGNVTVTASNACGTSAAASYAVAPSATLTAPTISGPAAPCQNTSQSYTATAVSGASGYLWTVPSGWNIQSYSSGGATVNVTTGSTSGNVTAAATNSCGTGPTSAGYAVAVGQNLNAPSFTASSGSTNSTNPCANNGGYIYQVTAQTAATYNWTLPSGWVVTSPTGISGTTFSTSTNAITVTPNSTAGTVTATLSGPCNGSPTQNTQLNVTPQAQPAAPVITPGSSAFCGGVSNTFTATFAVGAGTVAWTGPAGWTFGTPTTTPTSSTVVATPGTNAVVGNITATLTNSNGCTSPTATAAVTSGSTAPGTINGSALPTASKTGLVYSITAVSGATSYNWTVPTGWAITATTPVTAGPFGGTTLNTTAPSITVTSGTTAGTIYVSASNGTCTSAASAKVVDINQPTVYTAVAYNSIKKATCYAAGDVLYSATDGNGAITNTTVTSGSLPAGVALATNGTLSVSTPASLPASPPSFTVTTTDVMTGQTQKTFTLTFGPDQAATQATGVQKVLESYANNDVLMTYSDPDGAITTIALASGNIPAGTALQISGNNGVLIVTDRTKLSPGAYSFTVTTSNGTCSIGSSNTASAVTLGNSRALPIELTAFSGQVLSSGQVLLTWSTAQELNNLRFDVQRSADGAAFSTIGEVAGSGTTATAHSYRFTDATSLPSKGLTYYRLRQVDKDGDFHYSPVLALLASTKAARLTVELSPNPTQDVLHVLMAGPEGGQELTIYALSGKLLLHQLAEASATVSVQQLPAGMYLLQVRTADGQQLTRRFVKE
ncbi:T9SS type A sorting domain-containing protein [Hymenobacter rubidus]|uniref:T9SS type A sorting domain-containing protein n=1 Tax=Hymenobacter rubidus TaxID=1441626 RepID=UPI00191C9168|nr:T9SS type A sorting domain-containing protein [Hymenobacter rubidus]